MSQTTVITNHDEIRRWAEERQGRPAIVRTGQGPSGVLRFDFGDDDARLEEISWEEFFRVFDENQLALLRQDEASSGQQSRFFKFVDRNTSSGVSHRMESGETEMSKNREEPRSEALIGDQEDMHGRQPQRSSSQRADDTNLNDMAEDTSADMAEDRAGETARPRRTSTRRPAAKRSAAKRTSTRGATGRSASGGAKRGSAARKTGGRKAGSTSKSSQRSGARKTASRKAPAKKGATKRASTSRRGSTGASRSRSTRRAGRSSR
jgi:hypothetical protein